MFIFVGIFILLLATLFGFLLWAASDLPMAFREMAMNSREDKTQGGDYPLLQLLSILIKLVAVLTWISGVICSFSAAVIWNSSQFQQILAAFLSVFTTNLP